MHLKIVNMKNIADVRRDYKLETLEKSGTLDNPIAQFEVWWKEVIESNIDESNAMTLCTVGANNHPSARIVLLKGFSAAGFVFFTNYDSRKATDITANPHASLVFFWKELERQVRVEGIIEKVSGAESDEYFNSRPEASKIGAWVSPQSKVIASRETLEETEARLLQQYNGIAVPRPPHWGGYLVKPSMIEFWQGRPGRLHDRIRYSLKTASNNPTENVWSKERLAP